MADPDWIGNAPESPYWSDDGGAVYFEKKRAGSDVRDLYRLDLATGESRRVEDRERGAVSVAGGDWSEDRRRKVYAREGDIYLRDLTGGGAGGVRQLTSTGAEERDPFFLVGEREVAYRREDAFFARDLATGLERQVVDLRLEKEPGEEKSEKSYLEEQQERLFEVLREREGREKASRDRARQEQRGDPARPPLPFYLGDEVRIVDVSLSPDARSALVLLGKKNGEDGGAKRDKMPVFVTETGYVDVEEVRPKVGEPKPESPQVVLLDLAQHQRHDLDYDALPGIKDDPLAALRKKAEAAGKARQKEREEKARAERESEDAARAEEEEEEEEKAEHREDEAEERATRKEKAKEKDAARKRELDKDEDEADGEKAEDEAEPEKPKARVVAVEEMLWSDDGGEVALQIYSYDNKDRWIARVDLGARKLVPVERITDQAWINWTFRDLGWMRDSKTLWYLSEESGFSQLYLRPLAGKKRALTRGEFEVSDPVLARDGKSFWVTANRQHPGIFEAHRVDAATGELTQLTALGGVNEWVLSPDETRLLVSHAVPTRRPDLFLQEATPGATARRLTESASPEFAAIPWREPEFVAVPSRHGARPIHSRLYTPADWAAGPPRPAVLFVHGAGYLQNAHQGWSSYFREFMFHSLLVGRGYVVLDMDYRASAGYGRDWRTAIYRQMGHPEVEDLEDGVAWLVANRNVDPRRVGVYGGSYGGFLTFMALFRQPELFAAGAALRPVTDWAHYNHPYTSNILNTPEVDPEAYEKSSPIEFAAGLRKPLLICHGMVDDNVVFQDSVRLVQRLIELEKTEYFETAIYPMEPHGFREPSSWLDEYKRVLELFETELSRSSR